jgi:hypothetical protein
MTYPKRSFLFFLVSSLLAAQDNTPNLMTTREYDLVRPVSASLPISFVRREADLNRPAAIAGRRLSAGFRRDILLLPQASGTNTPAAQPAPSKPRYWTKRRVAILAIGLGIAGGGAAMWTKGKDLPNTSYNVNACTSALLSGGVGTGLNPVGDAVVGKYCSETTPNTGKTVRPCSHDCRWSRFPSGFAVARPVSRTR